MNNDRFDNIDDEVKQLVLDFERTVLRGESQFFDADELEMIMDYYLETNDIGVLSRAVDYAESLYPAHSGIKLRKAHLLISQERYEPALSLLLRLRDVEPENGDIAYSLGVCYGAMGESEKAVAQYKIAARDGWELGRIYANIAEELYRQGKPDESVAYFEQSLDADPDDMSVLYSLFDYAQAGGQVPEAARYLEHFVERHPYCKEAWHCLGCAYRDLQQWDQAFEAYEYALAIDSRFFSAYIDLSVCYEQAGRVGEAATALVQSLDCADSRSDVYVRLASLFGRNGNLDMCLVYARKAVDNDPDSALAHATLSVCLAELGELAEGRAEAELALRLEGANPDVLAAAAHVYECVGDIDTAEECYTQLLATDCAEHHHLSYALFLSNRAQWNDLMFYCQQMLEIYPDNVYFRTYLAAAFFNTGRYNRARRLLPDVDPTLMLELCPTITDNSIFMQQIFSKP